MMLELIVSDTSDMTMLANNEEWLGQGYHLSV